MSRKPTTVRTVTRADLIDEVVRVTALNRKAAEEVVEAFLGSIVSSLQEGHKTEIRGFGSFRLRRREGRLARNPKRSGVKVAVPARNIAYFRPGKRLKALLDERATALGKEHPAELGLPVGGLAEGVS